MFQIKICYDRVHYNQILCVNKKFNRVQDFFLFSPPFPPAGSLFEKNVAILTGVIGADLEHKG